MSETVNRDPAPEGFEEVIARLIADAEDQKNSSSKTLELTALDGVTRWLGGMRNAYRSWDELAAKQEPSNV